MNVFVTVAAFAVVLPGLIARLNGALPSTEVLVPPPTALLSAWLRDDWKLVSFYGEAAT